MINDSQIEYKLIVGLEIHVQLKTHSKLFCSCPNHFGDEPNTNVCPVCMGSPGTLPVLNGKAYESSVRMALALNCDISTYTKWDRKSYYYPDLPKDYQISQYDLPLGHDGYIEVPLSDGSTKKIRVLRTHLEEDAGKNVHDNPGYTGVDLNRAGVPLLEIVSEPDMHSVDEVMAYARSMQRLVRWLGIGEANMQMGHMRFEPNINLHITWNGQTYKTPIVEVKNLNSFRSLERAVAYEVERSLDEWKANPEGFVLSRCGKQNRGFDDTTGQTVYQREKEQANDYRYFPDPDLMPVEVDEEWIDEQRATIGELPLARRARYMNDYELTFKEADALTQDVPTGDLLDAAIADGAEPKRCVNLLLSRGAAIANEKLCTIAEIGVTAKQLGELAKMLAANEINATIGAKIFDMMIASGDSPKEIATKNNMLAVSDSGQIEQWVDAVLAANADAVAEIKSNGKKAVKVFGFLVGQVMRQSKGQATPQRVEEIMRARIGE